MISSRHLVDAITLYTSVFPADRKRLEALLTLIAASPDATSRYEFRGHVTCSALVTLEGKRFIAVHHRALSKWLLPGGHIEPQDASLRAAALRELREEIGLRHDTGVAENFRNDECPIQIDRHTIPQNIAKGEPAHEHWDFRYFFRSGGGPVSIAVDELEDIKYFSIGKLPPELQKRLDNGPLVRDSYG